MDSLSFSYKPIKLEHNENPLVFLDLEIDSQNVGRIVIELYKHIVPVTAENFRALCTGEKVDKFGKSLHYKGSRFHKIMPYFMCQGGDIVKKDGSAGYSIYGPHFELENFIVSHKHPGTLSMVTINDTFCNSQFIITYTDCPHLDGRSVAFGRVVRGFSCVQEMCQVKTNNDAPKKQCTIADCGVFEPDKLLVCQSDDTGDALPHGPDDFDFQAPVQRDALLSMIEIIINSAKLYYKRRSFRKANAKFQKALRYIQWSRENINDLGIDLNDTDELKAKLKELEHTTNLNLTGSAIELGNIEECLEFCDKVLAGDKDNIKALFRKAKALRIVKDYNDAMRFLKQAHNLQPNNTLIEQEMSELRNCQSAYLVEEKKLFSKMFNFN